MSKAKHGKAERQDKRQPKSKSVSSAIGTKRQRIRERVEFWLELDKPEDFELGDVIHELKSKRKFSRVVKDGIRLVVDLSAGNLDVLFELFPWVRAKFMQDILGDVAAQFEGVVLKAAAAQPIVVQPEASQVVATRHISDFDDDDGDTIILTQRASADVGANFMNMLDMLQGD